ncbi:MAG: hypothetical protein U0234_00540 [Sandaracinus sp.]
MTDHALVLPEMDAEDIVVAAALSDHDVLTMQHPLLVARGVEPGIVVALRYTWVGSTKPISSRWAAAIGMSRVRSVDSIADATRRSLPVVRARLHNKSIHALPVGSKPRDQLELAKEVWAVAVESDIELAARAFAIRPQEAALYRRRYARVLAELAHAGIVATDTTIRRTWEAFAVTPSNIMTPWTSSPPTMWALLPEHSPGQRG